MGVDGFFSGDLGVPGRLVGKILGLKGEKAVVARLLGVPMLLRGVCGRGTGEFGVLGRVFGGADERCGDARGLIKLWDFRFSSALDESGTLAETLAPTMCSNLSKDDSITLP